MSKTALAFLGVYGVALVAALVFPPAGVWGYLFEWYNHPPFRWWGKPLMALFGTRWSFCIGAAAGLGLLLNYGRYASAPFLAHGQTRLILLYTANAFLVSLWAYEPEASWEVAIDHLKMLVVFWCIVKTHSDKRFLPIILYICIIGCMYWGWDATFGPSGGRWGLRGAPGVGGESFVGPHAIAFLPLVGLYALTTKGWLRWTCLLGAPLLVNLVAHSQRRGAFLALIAAALALLVFSRRRLRWWALVGLLLGTLVGLRLFHDQFWARQRTIPEYEQDAAAMGRIYAWEAAWKLAQENPLGYGGESFDRGLGARLMPRGFHTTHNMFFEVLVAWGVQGVLFMFGFILLTCRDCWRLGKQYWDGWTWPPPREAITAIGILCGLCSMLVASMFLNRYRWELWWIFAGVVVCMKNIYAVERETEDHDLYEETEEDDLYNEPDSVIDQPSAPELVG